MKKEEAEELAYAEAEKYLREKCKFRVYFGESPHETYIFVGNRGIGFVQELHIDVVAKDQKNRSIEVVLPLLKDNQDFAYAKLVIEKSINALKIIPQVKVILNTLDDNTGEIIKNIQTSSQWESSDKDFEKSIEMVGRNLPQEGFIKYGEKE